MKRDDCCMSLYPSPQRGFSIRKLVFPFARSSSPSCLPPAPWGRGVSVEEGSVGTVLVKGDPSEQVAVFSFAPYGIPQVCRNTEHFCFP